jgi:hypothetical protein
LVLFVVGLIFFTAKKIYVILIEAQCKISGKSLQKERNVPCGKRRKDKPTDMTKLTVVFFASLRTLLKCVLRVLCRLEEQRALAECAVETACWESL